MIDLGEFSPVPSEHYATVCHIVAGIARSCDLGTVEQYMSFMTPDAVFEFPAMPHVGLAAHAVRGHDEIRAGVEKRRATGAAGPGSHTVHLISTTNAWMIDESTVRGLSFFAYYGNTDKVPELRSMGHYDNTFRKVDGMWLLSHRIISTL
jgi:hypothetical protein